MGKYRYLNFGDGDEFMFFDSESNESPIKSYDDDVVFIKEEIKVKQETVKDDPVKEEPVKDVKEESVKEEHAKEEYVKEESSSPSRPKRRTARVKNPSRAGPLSRNEDRRNFGNWSPEEDSILLQFINENGAKSWSKLSEKLGGVRNAQQCKRRWNALTRLILQRKKID